MTAPPVALKLPHIHEIHGDRREDPYYWLREKESESVLAYLKAENEYADAAMIEHKALEDALFEEIKGRIPQDQEGVPQVGRCGWWYSWRIKDGDQYKTYFRTRDGEEQVLLDLNELGKEHDFVGLSSYACPKGSDVMWYLLDLRGDGRCQLHARNVALQTEVSLPALEKCPEFSRVSSLAVVEGSPDALWFTVEDETTKRTDKLYFWRIGDQEPTLIVEELDERFGIGLGKTADYKYILVEIGSHITDEVWFADATSLKPHLKPLMYRQHECELSVEHHGDHWFVLTNWGEDEPKRNFMLHRVTDPESPEGDLKVLIPHREHVLIEGFEMFTDHMVVYERAEGITSVFVYDLEDGEILNRREVKFPEALIECGAGANYVTDTHLLRVGYQSPTTPGVVYDCDMRTMEMTELKRVKVLGGYDHENYAATRVYADASDGTKIPVTVMHRKDTALDGTAPGYMAGYGAYGWSYELFFAGDILSLLDRGFVYAIAHIRGGSELGKPWHDQGRMENKINSFTDFIACAEHLGSENIIDASKLAIEGRSAGGLLMGAVLNMRPDLFAVVYAGVPFVDVLTTMLDDTIPLTVGEFEEWGNPSIPAEYERMKAYSPYDNVEEKDYPAVLVRTSYHDGAVMYWEPAKWVAKLRATKTDSNPLLFRCNMGAGHGGSSARFDYYRETAADFTFICTHLGITT